VSTAATYSLLPLLYRQEEYAIKMLLLALHVSGVWLTLRNGLEGSATTIHHSDSGIRSQAKYHERFYGVCAWKQLPLLFTAGIVLLEAYCTGIHVLLFGEKFSFLPLMLTSVYCGIGMSVVWVGMAVEYVLHTH
jgi:ALG6, ALG8 glycosyltransferase family